MDFTHTAAAQDVLDTVENELQIAHENGQVEGDPRGFAADVVVRLVKTYNLQSVALVAAEEV